MSPLMGTSRQLVARHQVGRYWREADIDGRIASANLVENDPFRTSAALASG
jgi:hypothetical protein